MMPLLIDHTNIIDVDVELDRLRAELFEAMIAMELPDWWLSTIEKSYSYDAYERISRDIALLDNYYGVGYDN